MQLWEHTAEELLTLPMPDLALLVLADFSETAGWNQRNWLLEARHHHPEHCAGNGLLERLAEAWGWLNAKALVSVRPDQDSPDSRRVTEEGQRALQLGLSRLHAAQRLDVDLSPELQKAKRQFLQGDYEEAVFASFRTVEEAVRAAAGMSAKDLGVKLMRQAFQPATGPLADSAAEGGEQEALSALFSGAIGTFKNPSSHRTVTYDDPTVAAEAVLLADLLLRLVGRRFLDMDEQRHQGV